MFGKLANNRLIEAIGIFENSLCKSDQGVEIKPLGPLVFTSCTALSTKLVM